VNGAPEPGKRETARFGVVDIGSNSVRLVVYDGLHRAPLVLLNEKAICRLGEGIEESGRLDAAGMGRALAALARFRTLLAGLGAEEADAFATAAVRRAADRDRFLALAARTLGRPVAVLSGEEEARATALGVAGGLHGVRGLVADLGGGSIEFARVEGGRVTPLASLPVGTLSLRPALARGRRAAAEEAARALVPPPTLVEAAREGRLYLVGGGWRAIARIHLGLGRSPLPVVHGLALRRSELLALLAEIRGMRPERLARLPGLGRRRVETLPAAALLLEVLLRHLAPGELVFSATGLREGRLFARLGAEAMARDPLLEGARRLAAGEARDPAFAGVLEDWLAPLLSPPSSELGRLQRAAVLLSDVGWREHPDSRAAATFARLSRFPFLGIDHPGRIFLARTVFLRYGGAPKDRALRPLIELLDPETRRAAAALGAAMHLAYRLSGGVGELLARSRLRLLEEEVLLEVPGELLPPDPSVLGGRLRRLAKALDRPRHRLRAV